MLIHSCKGYLRLQRKDYFQLETNISKIYPLSSILTLISDTKEMNIMYANIKRMLLSSNYLFNYKKNQSQMNFILHVMSLISMITVFITVYSSAKITIDIWNWKIFKLFIPSLQIIPHWFFFYYQCQHKANIILHIMKKSSQIVLNNYISKYTYRINNHFDIDIIHTNKEYIYYNHSEYYFISYIINIPTFEKKYYEMICSHTDIMLIDEIYRMKLDIKNKYIKIYILRYLLPICMHFVCLVYMNVEMNIIQVGLMFGLVVISAVDLREIKEKIRREIKEEIENGNRMLIKKGYYIYVSEWMFSIIRMNINKEWKDEDYKVLQKKIEKLFEV